MCNVSMINGCLCMTTMLLVVLMPMIYYSNKQMWNVILMCLQCVMANENVW